MKAVFFIFIFCLAAQAEPQSLMDINPYSIEEIEAVYPQAIEENYSLDESSTIKAKVKQPPKFKVKKEINYAKLVPELIKLVQQQKREIEQLKREQVSNNMNLKN